jgi:hypothetical protein
MKKREQRREVPKRSTVLVVDLGPDFGDHHFKLPSPLKAAKILRSVDAEHIAVLASLQGLGDGGLVSAIARIRHSGVELMQVVGALIGVSWRHVDYDLEADVDAFESILEYGEACYEELDEEGYDFGLLSLLAMRLATSIVDRNTLQAEAMDRLGFSAATTEPMSSSSLTSGSTTSETPGVLPN